MHIKQLVYSISMKQKLKEYNYICIIIKVVWKANLC